MLSKNCCLWDTMKIYGNFQTLTYDVETENYLRVEFIIGSYFIVSYSNW